MNKEKSLIQESEESRALVKSLSKQIGPLKKAGESADELMAEVAKCQESY